MAMKITEEQTPDKYGPTTVYCFEVEKTDSIIFTEEEFKVLQFLATSGHPYLVLDYCAVVRGVVNVAARDKILKAIQTSEIFRDGTNIVVTYKCGYTVRYGLTRTQMIAFWSMAKHVSVVQAIKFARETLTPTLDLRSTKELIDTIRHNYNYTPDTGFRRKS